MKVKDRRSLAWHEADPDNKDEDAAFWREPRSITVHDPESDTVDTGLLDASGRPIHRRVMQPIGFKIFNAS